MGAILDIIGSYVFKAAMIGIIVATSINLNEVMVEKNQLTIAEKNLNVAISILEWDLKNIGYNYVGTTPFIGGSLNDYAINFRADVDNDGIVDSVYWGWQSNGYDPDVGYIYDIVRIVNGVSFTIVRRVYWSEAEGVSWRFLYYDQKGLLTGLPSAVRGIKVRMKMKSDVKLKGEYLVAEREFTVFPPNLSL